MIASLVLLGVILGQGLSTGAVREPPLVEAAKLSRADRVAELVAAGADVNAADWRGYTPLMWAAAAGSLDAVQRLLDGGAAVERRATDGSTALLLAAANGFTGIVRLLLPRGANVAAVQDGNTARALAAARGHVETAALLEDAERLAARLQQAAADGHGVLARQLLSLGAPYNTPDARGVTPLMSAARNGDLGMLQFLLSRGADAAARDADGLTAIDWAMRSPATGKYVAAFLRDRGAAAAAAKPAAAAAVAPGVKDSLKAAAGLLERVPPATGEIRAAHRRAAAALSELQTLSRAWPAESPADYRVNLARDVRLLQDALAQGHAAAIGETLQALADDLEIKLEHCRSSGGKLGGSVVVRVRTLQAGQETRSWQIFYLPKVLELAENAAPDLFPLLSSPTEEPLVPGRYIFWARHPESARLSERAVVKVGEGRKELALDLPVPGDQRP